MVTHVVAKQTKTKTNLLMEKMLMKKKFKRVLSCLFGGRQKVQFRRKQLGDKVQVKSSNLPCCSVANLVSTPLEFAAFRSGFKAKYSRASAFWFFLSTTMFLRRSEHILSGKAPDFHVDRQLVMKKEMW